MENITNKNNLISFEISDQQILQELLTKLGVFDEKGIYQEDSIEILENLTAKPNALLTDFLSKPQDILYSKLNIEKKEAFSLWDFYKETNDTKTSLFQVVGSSALYFLGYDNLVEQLKKVRVKKNQQSLWDLLPLNIQHALKELCQKRGNDLDVRIQKKDQKYLNSLLNTAEQFLIKKLKPSSEQLFIDNFYTNRKVMSNENTFWTIQSFYYGNCTVDYCQFVKAPRTYRFIKEALLLEVDLDKDQIELKTKNPIILIQSLLNVILKNSQSDLNNLLEDNDLGMLAYNQSRFETCSRDEDEKNLIKQVFKENNKQNNTAKLEKILKTTHKKHSNKSLSLLVCLLLNSLRICAPYIDEEQLFSAMKQEISFSEKKSYIHTLCTMLLQKIDFEKISAVVQVLAFAALHHKVFIDKKKICLVKHREVEHLQIGNENSILLKWDIEKALKVVEEHFNSLSPFFSSCLLDLIEPLNLSEREIFFIAAHGAGEFELASREFSLLNKKSKALLGRIFSNPQIPLKEKNIYLSTEFSLKKDEEELSFLLTDLNHFFGKCEQLPDTAPFPESVIEQILKSKDNYPHLIGAIPLRKIHLVWQKEFQNVKENQNKLLFFINAIEFYHQFKLPHQLESITLSNPSNTEPFLKIDSKSSYIHTLCEMLLKSIDLEKINAALQVAFFVSMHESSSKSSNQPFVVIQIGEEKGIFLKCDIKKAIKVVESHFEVLSDFLPQLIEEPSLSAEEILFIAGHEAKDTNCALKMSKWIKVSVRNLERFLSHSNIPKNQKISYLLGVLNFKNSSDDISAPLSTLNTLLIKSKRNACKLDLPKWCLELIWNNQEHYPHIFSQFSEKMIKEFCNTEFKLIKDLKDQFNFINEKINFYKKNNLSIDFQDLTIPLYTNLYKQSFFSEAAQLRALYKNNKEVQCKMPLKTFLKKKTNKQKVNLLENKNFAEVLSLIHCSDQLQKTQLLKNCDQPLSKLLSEMVKEPFQKLNWKTLKQYLKDLPQTKMILDQKLNEFCLTASSIEEIELLQYHSKHSEILFQAAKRLKENLILSKKCFELIFKTKSTNYLIEEIDFIEFFCAYEDELSLLWLMENLPTISKLFSSAKEENLLKALDKTAEKLISKISTLEQNQKFFNTLFLNDIWTPFLAECFTTFYAKLHKENQLFIEPQKENRYENLIKNISSLNLLTNLFSLCLHKEPPYEDAFSFIKRLKTLLENKPELKDEKTFIDIEKALNRYFLDCSTHFLEKGATRKNWGYLVELMSQISTHLQDKSKKFNESIISKILFHLALFENDLNVFNELYDMHLKNKNNQDSISFLQLLCSNINLYLKNSSEIEIYLASYQQTNSIKPSSQIKTTRELDPWEPIKSYLTNISNNKYYSTLIKLEKQEIRALCDHDFNPKLKIFYLKLKDIITSLIKKDTDLSGCILLSLTWTLKQLQNGNQHALAELVNIKNELFEKIKREKLEKTIKENDKALLVQLTYASSVLQNKKHKENEFEKKFILSIDKKSIDFCCFYLIHEVSLFKNSFSHAFIYEIFKKNDISSFLEDFNNRVDNEWLKEHRPQIIRTWIIQMLLKHFENIKSPVVDHTLLYPSLIHVYAALKNYFFFKTFNLPLIEELLNFRLIINSFYEITMKFYFQKTNKKSAKKLSESYYKLNEAFLLSIKNETQLARFNYSASDYASEVVQIFDQLARSPLRTLLPEFWKENINEWQEYPHLLLCEYPEYGGLTNNHCLLMDPNFMNILNIAEEKMNGGQGKSNLLFYKFPESGKEPTLYTSVCQNFIHILNENQITITDEILRNTPLIEKKSNSKQKN